MRTEIWVALISGLVAVVSAIVGTYSAIRSTKIQQDMQLRLQAEKREDDLERIISRFREPLLRSAFDLQSRLHNILHTDFVILASNDSAHGSPGYIRSSTLFRLAQYFSWVEILRRRIQFLDLGDQERTRQLSARLDAISKAFAETAWYPPHAAFQLYRDEQRAIGELVTQLNTSTSELECMQYVQFVSELENNSAFSRWFGRLSDEIERLANPSPGFLNRMAKVEVELTALLVFLDPNGIRFPTIHQDDIGGP